MILKKMPYETDHKAFFYFKLFKIDLGQYYLEKYLLVSSV